MECNRDEAARAKLIAERKLTEKDFSGAKKFALKAFSLYPELEGLSQLSTTIDIYISAENKISGEVDWYGILGVDPLADDENVKKQYRKLALMLHPDKNKSVGAEGAFKLISEAWSLLSDKGRRLAYNQRRSLKGLQQKVSDQSRGPSATPRPPPKGPPSVNGFHYFSKNTMPTSKTQNNSARVCKSAMPPVSKQRTDTFWTICHRCKMHYEYLRIYLNNTLLCPNCREAFRATEMAAPVNYQKSTNISSFQRQHPVSNTNKYASVSNAAAAAAAAQNPAPGGSSGVNSFDRRHVRPGHFPKTADGGSTIPSPHPALKKAANVVGHANEKMKRGYEETRISNSVLQGEALLKKSRVTDANNGYGGSNITNQMLAGGYGRSAAGYVHSVLSTKPNTTRELTQLELRNMLIDKAQKEICKKLNEWKSKNIAMTAEKGKKKVQESAKEKKGTVKVEKSDPNGYGKANGTEVEDEADDKCSSSPAAVTEKEAVIMMSIDVPDPDFHEFDLDRTEKCFGENQVWAAYDDDDGMPRFYAMIHKVISLKPFKMRISWLNSKSTSEFGPLNWLGSGFAKPCGELRIGKHEIFKSLNSFSHKVKWTKGPRGVVCIYPKKGDVWALFRNWSPNWNEHTPDAIIHKYDMVEIFDDYNENEGVSVTPLIKAAGFRTVFRPCRDTAKVMKIPKEEMFRFSHQVPNYLLTGQEAPNAPIGCQELDPAAAPLELLQIISEADVASMEEEIGKQLVGEVSGSTLENKKDGIVDNSDVKGEKEVVACGE